MAEPSPAKTLSVSDLPAILKSAGLGLAVVVVGWAAEYVTQIDYGVWTPVVMGAVVPALAVLKRWLTDYTK